jgi:hypothetical protein
MAKKKRSPKKVDAPKAMGRPTKYTPGIVQKVAVLSEYGLTNEEIADATGISVRTLYFWQEKHSEFLHAIKDNKSPADDLVELSLFRRAVGYTEKVKRKALAFGKVVEWEETLVFPPDPTCMKFWLMNRRPAEWREHVEPKPDGDLTLNIKIGHEDDEPGDIEHEPAAQDATPKADSGE